MAPDPEALATFKEFAGCYDDEIAIRILRANNNNVENAVGDYLENLEKYLQGPIPEHWDDTVWGQDRYGPGAVPANADDTVPNIIVQGPDGFPSSSAPTRPPSRASHGADTGSQETGLVGGSGDGGVTSKYFGPPTKPYYPESQWALTAVGAAVSSVAPVYPDAEPVDRTRAPADGEPAFVKPDPSLELAPALLTIIGQVPMVLQYFLRFGTIADKYGGDTTWWKGSVIKSPLTIDLDSPDPEADHQWYISGEAMHEMHRIAAFFLTSRRAYYTDPIFKLFQEFKDHQRLSSETRGDVAQTMVSSFAETWISAAQYLANKNDPADLFASHVVDLDSDGKRRVIPFYEWSLSLPVRFGGSKVSLYDAMDETLWELDIEGDSAASYWLDRTPHILILNVANKNFGANSLDGMEVPLTLHIDRYLKENVAATKEMRRKTQALRETHELIYSKIKRLGTFKSRNANTDNVEVLFNSSVKFLQDSQAEIIEEGGDDSHMTKDSTTTAELLQTLDILQARVRKKIEDFQDEQARLVDEFRTLSKAFIDPPPSEGTAARSYTLAGIATSEEDVYMQGLPRTEGEQPSWWHVHYSTTAQVKRARVDVDDVVKAAQWNSEKVMFVYAREGMLQPSNIQLPPSLETFIQQDNEYLNRELEDYEMWAWKNQQPANDGLPAYAFNDDAGNFVPDLGYGNEPPPQELHFNDTGQWEELAAQGHAKMTTIPETTEEPMGVDPDSKFDPADEAISDQPKQS